MKRGGKPLARFTKNQFQLRQTSVESDLDVAGDLAVAGALSGNGKTRGEATFTGDGKRQAFTVGFPKPLRNKPVVVFSTNQFARSRLKESSRENFTVAFESAPKANQTVTITWLAQQ